jgi:hypothetical protein
MTDTNRPETLLQKALRELVAAATAGRTTVSAADVAYVLSEQGRRTVASVEWLLLDVGYRLDLRPAGPHMRIPFQTPADYRQGVQRYALLCEIDPHPATPDGFECVALLFWIHRYEAVHLPSGTPSQH